VKRVNKGEEAGSNFAAAFGFNAFSVFPSCLSIFPRLFVEFFDHARNAKIMPQKEALTGMFFPPRTVFLN